MMFNKLRKALNWVKNNKTKTAIGVGAGYLGYKALTSEDNPSQQNQQDIPSQLPIPEQTQGNSIDIPPVSPSQFQAQTVQPYTNPKLDKDLLDFTKFIKEFANKTQEYGKLYEDAFNKFKQVHSMYEEKLNDVLPMTTLFLSKTGLGDITTEDLPQMMREFFRNMPYTVATNYLPSFLKGYYTLKLNGIDATNLNLNDILLAGQNPALVSSLPENVNKSLQQIGTVLQYKIKQNLDDFGIERDRFSTLLNVLKVKADAFNDLFKSLLQTDTNREELINRVNMQNAELENRMAIANLNAQLEAQKQNSENAYREALLGIKQQPKQTDIFGGIDNQAILKALQNQQK